MVYKKNAYTSILKFLIIVIAASLPGYFKPIEKASAAIINSAQSENSTNEMLQFTSEGHILGFSPEKVYLAGIDHALTVSFINGNDVMPKDTSFDPSNEKEATPLEQVTYEEVWDGIDIVYSTSNGSIAKSTLR